MNPDDLRKADAIEVVIGQGAKPGGGGMLLGHKISKRVAEMRTLPEGIDQRSACRHPDWTGPDDLEIKIEELREITDWEKPIYVKVGASRPYYDTALAVKSGADVVVIDGMQGGTAATQEVFIENVGIPTLAAIRPAVQALQDLGLHRKVQLVISGGIRNGADVAKCLALGAKAVAIGHSALMALNCNKEIPGVTDYEGTVGVPAGRCYHCHTGRCPVGITTQDPELRKRLRVDEAAERVYNFLHTLTLEAQMLARACGKTNVHSLEPEDLCALTVEASAMARVPLAGTNYIPGQTEERALAEIKALLEKNLPGGNGASSV
jgi:glutamate synthase domain-containing protein 2